MTEIKSFKDLQIYLFKYFYYYYIGLIIFSVYTAVGGIIIPIKISQLDITKTKIYTLIFFFILSTILNLAYHLLQTKFVININNKIYRFFYSKMIKNQEKDTSKKIPSSVYSNINDISRDSVVLIESLISIFPTIVLSINTTIFYFYLNHNISILFIIALILRFVFILIKKNDIIKYSGEYNIQRNKLMNWNQDLNYNFASVLSMNNLKNEYNNLENKINNFQINYENSLLSRLQVSQINTIIDLIFVILSMLFLNNLSKQNLIAFLISYLSFSQFMSGKISKISLIFQRFGKLDSSLENVNKYLSSPKLFLPSSIISRDNNIPLYSTNKLLIYKIKYNFSNKFSIFYENISFNLNQCNILKGGIGKGKSTLLKILFGLYTFNQGDIYLDNKLLDYSNKNNIRKIFHYLEQNPPVFNRTILENINYPIEDNNNQKKILNSTIDNTLKSILNQNNKKAGLAGENLSGGQKQIINLIRFFNVQKPIILLDEPTSSLDKINREAVYEIINKFKKDNVTLIIASHDSELIKLGDNIIEL